MAGMTLRALVAAAQEAADRTERCAIVADYLRDEGAIDACAEAWAEGDAGAVEADLVELAAVDGLSGLAGRVRSVILRRVRERRRASAPVRAVPGGAPGGVAEALEGLGVPEGLVVPSGWELAPDGVWVVTSTPEGGVDAERVTWRPIVPVGTAEDASDGTERILVAWRRRTGGWRRELVEASALHDRQRLCALADLGAPVSMRTAGTISRYLHEVVEASRLPVWHASSRAGWVDRDGGGPVYLWGRRAIGGDGGVISVADGDTARLADACRSAGTWYGWRAAVERYAVPYPATLLLVYASLGAAALPLLDAPSGIVELAGQTSSGKTTCLSLAASVWGHPVEYVGTWDVTATSLERQLAWAHAIPLCLDDTRRAATQRPEALEAAVYAVSQGTGRGRASPTGTRRTTRWRTLVLGTGEAPITSYGSAAGAVARALTIACEPFGGGDRGDMVAALRREIRRHYGHAGPRWVEWIAGLDGGARSELRERYESIVARYEEIGAVAGRVGELAAVLDVGAYALHDVLGVRRPAEDPWVHVERAVIGADRAADRPSRALADVWAWTCAHSQEMWGRHVSDRDGTPRQPLRGWAGAWSYGSDWSEIAYVPGALERILRHEGYRPSEIVDAWYARGWVRRDGNHARPKVTIADGRTRCVVVLRSAIETATGTT